MSGDKSIELQWLKDHIDSAPHADCQCITCRALVDCKRFHDALLGLLMTTGQFTVSSSAQFQDTHRETFDAIWVRQVCERALHPEKPMTVVFSRINPATGEIK